MEVLIFQKVSHKSDGVVEEKRTAHEHVEIDKAQSHAIVKLLIVWEV
jgi:hypothetical protein